ncbi:MAG: hypothetical protein H6R10_3462 [Rhodocyclaceae bacterium]|nr:hypothetical protein [Rhodocyclaceae bacterium]
MTATRTPENSWPDGRIVRGLALAVALLAPWTADADEAIGMVKTFKAPAFIVRQNQALPVQAGMPVYATDRLKTGNEGSLGVTLKDDTLLSSGPNSTLAIEQFAFNSTSHEGNMLLRVVKGTLSMISGLMVKANPEAARIRTPSATIGIRGTEFIVEVEGEGEE